MKKNVFIPLIFLVVFHIDGLSQRQGNRYLIQKDTIAVDSLKYELIIMDPGFDVWLSAKPSKEFYSKEYYELRNRLYVSEWNSRYASSRASGLYETYIDYCYSIDYGIDLNYKLYYYFKYFEEKNKVKLLPYGR